MAVNKTVSQSVLLWWGAAQGPDEESCLPQQLVWELELLPATPSPRNRKLRNMRWAGARGNCPALPTPEAAADQPPSEILAQPRWWWQRTGRGHLGLSPGAHHKSPRSGVATSNPVGTVCPLGPHPDPGNLERVRGIWPDAALSSFLWKFRETRRYLTQGRR